MGDVIGLSGVLGSRYTLAPRHQPRGQSQPGFTLRDRADLDAWSRYGRRAVLVNSEIGMFAMLHEGNQAWASWGVVRQSHGVLVWNCVTLADVDRFATMVEALAAIDGQTEPTLVENVISFMAHTDAGPSPCAGARPTPG